VSWPGRRCSREELRAKSRPAGRVLTSSRVPPSPSQLVVSEILQCTRRRGHGLLGPFGLSKMEVPEKDLSVGKISSYRSFNPVRRSGVTGSRSRRTLSPNSSPKPSPSSMSYVLNQPVMRSFSSSVSGNKVLLIRVAIFVGCWVARKVGCRLAVSKVQAWVKAKEV
jgi:hypothetical protein